MKQRISKNGKTAGTLTVDSKDEIKATNTVTKEVTLKR